MIKLNIRIAGMLLLALATAVMSQAAESEEAGGQASSFGASISFLPVNNFDSVLTRFSGGIAFGRIGDYSIRGGTDFGYRRTRDNAVFPEDLYRIGVKLSATDRLNHFEVGLSSASDKPFDSSDELNIYLSATREIKRWDKSSLRLGLAYSNRLDYPLPVLLYNYSDSDLTFMIGVPVASLRWKLNEKTTLAASYQPVRQARLVLEHKLSQTLKLNLEGGIEEESYYLAERINKDRSLVLEVPKVAFKVNKKFFDQLDLGLSIGRTFGGRFFERKNLFDEFNKEKIAEAWVSGVEVKYSF
jgi:hypothetical protein